MGSISRTFSRTIAMLLVCALIAASAPIAEAKPLTPETVHARILKRGLGNWVGVQVTSGAAFAGRIVSIDDQSFGLQLHNDPEITPVLYRDVTYLQTGLTGGQKALFIALPIAFAGAAIGAAVAFHNNEPKLPTMPTQPVFP
jgi:hypothetical protein